MYKNTIIWYDFPETTGNGKHLQAGRRPAYVIAETEENLLLAAITTAHKNNKMPTHVGVRLQRSSIIMMEQLFWVPKPEGYIMKYRTNITIQVARALEYSLGIIDLGNVENISYRRGNVYEYNGEKYVILQNNVGNKYSPTTIIGKLDEKNGITEIMTVDMTDLHKYVFKMAVPEEYLEHAIKQCYFLGSKSIKIHR